MSYIGVAPTAGQYRNLDDISGSFNGSTTTFTTAVSGQNVTAGVAQQLLVSLGGVVQKPGTDYTVGTNSITFTTAPSSGLSFFGILMGEAVNVGTPSDGTVTSAKLASDLTVDLASGTVSAPSLSFDSNTGLYSTADNEVAITTDGTYRAKVDGSGRLLVGTSTSDSTRPTNLQIVSTTGLGASELLSRYTADDGGSTIFFHKSRGSSIGTNTIVNNGDYIGTLQFAAADGTNYIKTAEISAVIDGTPGANDMPGRLVFSTTADGASSPTERMRITNNGFFKASSTGSYRGSASQYHELRSARNDEFVLMLTHDGTSGNQYGLSVETTNDQNNSGIWFLQCKGSTTLRAEIRTNGGIANYSANNVNLSDINTKKNITPAVNTWNCIKEWEIVNFHYKDQPDDADLNLGVIAQQVAESCPEVITVFEEAKDDQPEKLGIKEQQMYWMAIKALQEAQQRIETLEATNADLLARVTALESA